MITITQNSGCTFEVCMKKFKEIQEPYYLFNAISTNSDYSFVQPLTDMSEADVQSERFYLNTDKPKGEYVLFIHEQTQEGNTDLNNVGKKLLTTNLIIE